MKNRNIEHLLQSGFYLKALRSFYVFKVYASEGWCDPGTNLNELLRILLIDLNVKNIHICKYLEKQTFPFHHRLPGQCPDIS